jgi:endonuclease/exonuclease/phosphatase family metal-dependent hydrolase
MRITSWNLLHGMAIPPTTLASEEGSLAPSLRTAVEKIGSDVYGFQEVDHFLPRSNSADQILEIAQSIGAKDWAFAPNVIGTPGEKWRKLNKNDDELVAHSSNEIGSYGIGIVSKIAVLQWKRLNLGNSPIGMPLLVPRSGEGDANAGDKEKFGGLQPIYVRDEPRCALAAVLDNGFTVINTHLSFVPGVNVSQLIRLKRWALEIAAGTKTTPIIMGDLNLPKNLPVARSSWRSLATMNTYPSWKPSIQFDYLLAPSSALEKGGAIESFTHTKSEFTGISDHLPLSVAINQEV